LVGSETVEVERARVRKTISRSVPSRRLSSNAPLLVDCSSAGTTAVAATTCTSIWQAKSFWLDKVSGKGERKKIHHPTTPGVRIKAAAAAAAAARHDAVRPLRVRQTQPPPAAALHLS